ncbi:hypothetical protein RJ40_05830 [Methanofollis aquaemaris]|uniref:Uncharacterized protein n=1 Tax=Methanofollis aquaemaris TaxID=126734 RepID=A0A8A3S4H6_9EURY|nr:hypothetical protein [Methanofollis aquaemaris]QSZ67048.1 hypothetical protein RJ40_05830 [Methanofollis aquaemaris]
MMRRVYYRFPTRFDLNFSLMVPFPRAIGAIAALHRTHTNRREGADLFKHHLILEIADDRTRFLPVDLLPDIAVEVTESADFRFSIHETLLRPEGRVPVSENTFLVRVVDRGPQSEVFVVKEGTAGSLDALDVRDHLKGVCE